MNTKAGDNKHAKEEYNPKVIEPKWQKYWEEKKTFKVETPKKGEKKFYCLDMFPYPSGAGLHVGHPLGYTATDIYSRYKRMNGYKVLHPMGFDSFGLPAEQHALKTGEHPAIVTKQNCDKFTYQMKKIGFSYDWDRELATSNADYYHWTQWIFLKLYNSWFDRNSKKARPIEELPVPQEVNDKGELAVEEYRAGYRLAYFANAMVNWCPGLGTVLANEEVIDGKSEIGGHEVIRKPMKQWMMRITEYSDRLIDDLVEIDWPESIKEQQRNWIGRKSGAEIVFKHKASEQTVTAFTTRPDTLPGVTFFVISPENPLVEVFTTADKKSEVQKYQEESTKLSEFMRTLDNRKKTGVFTGGYIINPLTGEDIPVYVADYVLMSYGTGAVMGVPAHDERDFEFARLFNIPVKAVLDPQKAVSEKDREEVIAGNKCFTGEGIILNFPGLKVNVAGKPNKAAGKEIVNWLAEQKAGREVINYKLRDWLFSRQRYWGEPIPVIHWEDGLVTALKETDLPLVLPDVTDYKPSDGGESPLAKAKDWLTVTDPKTGKKGRRETNVMPQWAGSCWYYLRFTDPTNSKLPWANEAENNWMPVDLYVGGAEHAVLHLLYARFWHKVLFDLGYISTNEPFQKLFNQGMIVAFAYKNQRGATVAVDEVKELGDGTFLHEKTGEKVERITAKMSKTLRNVVDPLEIIEQYGADTLRLYLMFMGPLDAMRPWDSKAIAGTHRFLKRSFAFITDIINAGFVEKESEANLKLLHRTIKKVSEDIEGMRFNTAISALMEFINEADTAAGVTRNFAGTFALLLSPMASHLAEELWERLGNTKAGTLAYEKWPEFKPEYLQQSTTTVVIQIQGKKRASVEFDINGSESDLRAMIVKTMESTSFPVKDSAKFITVYQPGTKVPRLVNIV